MIRFTQKGFDIPRVIELQLHHGQHVHLYSLEVAGILPEQHILSRKDKNNHIALQALSLRHEPGDLLNAGSISNQMHPLFCSWHRH
jgi:hypothetical protein